MYLPQLCMFTFVVKNGTLTTELPRHIPFSDGVYTWANNFEHDSPKSVVFVKKNMKEICLTNIS